MTGKWPVGSGANKSSGVAAAVKGKSGSIGYVEYSWASTLHIPYAQMKNRSGKWVLPSLTTFAAAGAHAQYSWSNGYATALENMKGIHVWPITGETYILVRRSQSSYAQAHAMLLFFNWALTSSTGIKDARNLTFVPMPSAAAQGDQTIGGTPSSRPVASRAGEPQIGAGRESSGRAPLSLADLLPANRPGLAGPPMKSWANEAMDSP